MADQSYGLHKLEADTATFPDEKVEMKTMESSEEENLSNSKESMEEYKSKAFF